MDVYAESISLLTDRRLRKTVENYFALAQPHAARQVGRFATAFLGITLPEPRTLVSNDSDFPAITIAGVGVMPTTIRLDLEPAEQLATIYLVSGTPHYGYTPSPLPRAITEVEGQALIGDLAEIIETTPYSP